MTCFSGIGIKGSGVRKSKALKAAAQRPQGPSERQHLPLWCHRISMGRGFAVAGKRQKNTGLVKGIVEYRRQASLCLSRICRESPLTIRAGFFCHPNSQ